MWQTFLDASARAWENILARPDGPVSLRFILQPSIAAFMAIRAGVRDARHGITPYLWKAFKSPDIRKELLLEGWHDMKITFSISVVLDIVYQLIVHRFIYPLELLITATFLALVPYFILRGPINRLVRLFVHVNPPTPESARENDGKVSDPTQGS